MTVWLALVLPSTVFGNTRLAGETVKGATPVPWLSRRKSAPRSSPRPVRTIHRCTAKCSRCWISRPNRSSKAPCCRRSRRWARAPGWATSRLWRCSAAAACEAEARSGQPENYGLTVWISTIDGKHMKPNRELYGLWSTIHGGTLAPSLIRSGVPLACSPSEGRRCDFHNRRARFRGRNQNQRSATEANVCGRRSGTRIRCSERAHRVLH